MRASLGIRTSRRVLGIALAGVAAMAVVSAACSSESTAVSDAGVSDAGLDPDACAACETTLLQGCGPLGAECPQYAHIPLILNPDGSKMSKRDEGSAIEHSYMNAGYLPDAVFNYLCMLGWTPKAESEKLTRTELVALFDPEAIHSSNAKFDLKKSLWFNAQYLRELSPDDLLKHARPFLAAKGLSWSDDAMAAAAVHSVREKVSLLSELPEWVHYFFREDYAFEADVVTKLKAKPENASLLQAASAKLAAAGEWSEQSVHDAVEAAAKELSIKPGAMMPLLRFALSGQSRGPGVTTIAHLIGREATLKRIARTLSEAMA